MRASSDGCFVVVKKIILRTCKCTGILQDHGSCVEILSQGFLPFLHLAPFEGIPRGGPREIGISGIEWGHETRGHWIVIISRGNVAHRCLMGSRLGRRNQGDSDELEPRVSTSGACCSFPGPVIPARNFSNTFGTLARVGT
jgi:hypothetical protein